MYYNFRRAKKNFMARFSFLILSILIDFKVFIAPTEFGKTIENFTIYRPYVLKISYL